MAYDLREMDPAAACGGRWVGHPPPNPICGAAIDSRKIREGDLFIAVKTERDDGHNYLKQAAERGTAAAIVERADASIPIPQLLVKDSLAALQTMAAARRRQLRTCEVIAIAGSYGKTTTKELLALLLGSDCTCATEGNLNNCIGVPLSVLSIDESRHRYAAIEVGISRPGEMATIAGILAPKHVIFTGISAKHSEFFQSEEALFAEKLLICKSPQQLGGKISLPRRLAAARQLQPFRKNILAQPPSAAEFVLPDPSPGFFEDFSLCLAFCDHFSIDRVAIEERLASWKPPQLRGEIYRHKSLDRWYFADCYNSDLPALLNGAWLFAKKFANMARLFAIGAMSELGRRSGELHRLAGQRLPFAAGDRFLFVGNHTELVAEELVVRGLHRRDARVCSSLEEIKREVNTFSGAVFIKGSRVYAMESLLDFDSCEKEM